MLRFSFSVVDAKLPLVRLYVQLKQQPVSDVTMWIVAHRFQHADLELIGSYSADRMLRLAQIERSKREREREREREMAGRLV